jgi:hypothetical protein
MTRIFVNVLFFIDPITPFLKRQYQFSDLFSLLIMNLNTARGVMCITVGGAKRNLRIGNPQYLKARVFKRTIFYGSPNTQHCNHHSLTKD